jgi:hypothetical protein
MLIEERQNHPGFINLGSTKPEIAYAVLDMVEREWRGFWGYCEEEIGLSTDDLERIVANVKA